VTEDSTPIAYSALEKGVAVVSQSGRRFGTVERVLEDPAVGIFHGIVVDTPAGLRLVARDHVEQIYATQVRCALTDEQAGDLPEAFAEAPAAGPQTERPWYSPGYIAAGVVIVRCQRGGLFEDLWIPMASLKAIRLGRYRIQRCPVHGRVEVVQRVDPATLSSAERAQAALYPAGWVP
jgi:hypothetical protein